MLGLGRLVSGIFGTKNERELKRMRAVVEQINALEDVSKVLPDDALAARTAEFKERFQKGESLDQLLPKRSPFAAKPLVEYSACVITMPS
jgi:preprotein translocase subunit SecA